MHEHLSVNKVSALVFDQLLAEFVTESHSAGYKFWLAKRSALVAQTNFRHYKGKLPRAWDCISTWEAERPFRNRTPL